MFTYMHAEMCYVYTIIMIITLQHRQWRRIANEQGLEIIERNIFFNQTVNYTGNTITVFDADGIVIE